MFNESNFSIYIADKKSSIPPDLISYSMFESIHSVYTKGYIEIEDPTASIAEALLTMPGTKIKIELGGLQNLLNPEFVIKQDQMEGTSSGVMYTGTIQAPLIDSWYVEQRRGYSSYTGSASDVISRLLREYQINSMSDNTGTNRTWYQGGRTAAKFIEDDLLMHSYSANSQNTPLYGWKGLDGRFFLRSIRNLWEGKKPKMTLKYSNQSDPMLTPKTIISISRYSADLAEIKRTGKSVFYSVNDQGEIEEDNVSMGKVWTPKSQGTELLVDTMESGLKTEFFPWEGTETGDKEAYKARRIQQFRHNIFLDRFVLLIPYEGGLRAGDKIAIEIPPSIGSKNSNSERFSGDYLIEALEHIWDRSEKMLWSKLYIGRKFGKLPSRNVLKRKQGFSDA